VNEEPSASGPNGRDPISGRFLPGNAGGPGNPHAGRVAALRSALLATVSEEDLREILARLIEEAKAGSIAAAKEVLDRCLGRVPDWDSIDRRDSAGPLVIHQGIRLEVVGGSEDVRRRIDGGPRDAIGDAE
jgi:hypothetical protein